MSNRFSLKARLACALLCLGAFCLLWQTRAWAENLPEDMRAGYVQTLQLGDFTVLSLVDSPSVFKKTLLVDLKTHPEYAAAMPEDQAPGVVKTYLIRMPGRVVLMDTGWGTGGKPQGRTMDLLAARGIAPEAVTDVLLTHLHGDHVFGLVREGKPAFPKARVHIARTEYDAWMSGQVKSPADRLARTQEILRINKDLIVLFAFGDEILPGVRAEDTRGHTPGHTAYTLSSGGRSLCIVGDLLHLWAVQLRHPQASTVYDVDPVQAAVSRQATLQRLAGGKTLIAGMHFPMIGLVKALPGGGFAIVPEEAGKRMP